MSASAAIVQPRAVAILYRLAGSPAVAGAATVDSSCYLCAAPRCGDLGGVDRTQWMGANFTDQNKARAQASPHVCAACVWACSWVAPPGFVVAGGKERGPNLRQFWHAWHAGEYRYGNKADKAALRDWLRADKPGSWFAAIADSGQKHTLPWTPVNPPRSRGGLVRFEERTVAIGAWSLVDHITELLTLGATKDEIGRGDYRPTTMGNDDIARAVLRFEREWSASRHGAWFDLALWLAQRDEQAHAAIVAVRKEENEQGRSKGRAGAGSARGATPIPRRRRKPAEALDAASRTDAQRGAHDDDGRGMGDAVSPGLGSRRAEQRHLLGNGGAR